MEGQREVGILRQGVVGEAAGRFDRAAAEGADGAGDDGDAVPLGVGAAVEIEAADVFEALAARDEVAQVADARIAADGADQRVGNGATSAASVPRSNSVSASRKTTISCAHWLTPRRSASALPRLAGGGARRAVRRRRARSISRGGVVTRSVIHDDHFQFARVVGLEERVERFGDDFAFVVGGDDHAERAGREIERERSRGDDDPPMMPTGQPGDEQRAQDDERRREDHERPEEAR